MNLVLKTTAMFEAGMVGEAVVHALFTNATSIQWHYGLQTKFVVNKNTQSSEWIYPDQLYIPLLVIHPKTKDWFPPLFPIGSCQRNIFVVFLSSSRQVLENFLHFQNCLQPSYNSITYNHNSSKSVVKSIHQERIHACRKATCPSHCSWTTRTMQVEAASSSTRLHIQRQLHPHQNR